MNNRIVKTSSFQAGEAGNVVLEEMQDGKRHVRKKYINNASTEEKEWDALCYLYNEGFNVPKPYKRDRQGIYMQYIDGVTFADLFETADAVTQHELIDKFVKLLYDLHNVKLKSEPPPGRFVKNELSEIIAIIEKKQINHYREIADRLEKLSIRNDERPSCYIHRDYHIWNVLADKAHKLYLVDMELKQGDYRFDVGWTYMLMNRTGTARHNERYTDIAQIFLSGYCKLKPETYDDIEYFMQLANLRWLVNVAPDKASDKHRFSEMRDIAEQAIADFLYGKS